MGTRCLHRPCFRNQFKINLPKQKPPLQTNPSPSPFLLLLSTSPFLHCLRPGARSLQSHRKNLDQGLNHHGCAAFGQGASRERAAGRSMLIVCTPCLMQHTTRTARLGPQSP